MTAKLRRTCCRLPLQSTSADSLERLNYPKSNERDFGESNHEAWSICRADSFSRMRQLAGLPARTGQQEHNQRNHYYEHV